MFAIIRTKTLNRLKSCLQQAEEENERLFWAEHNRLAKPRRDKNGKLRNPDGTFAGAK